MFGVLLYMALQAVFWIIFITLKVSFGDNMDELVVAIISSAGAITVGIITLIVTVIRENRRFMKIIDLLGIGIDDKSITGQLGVINKSIARQLGVSDISITKQIGIGDDEKSLTGQHKDIINLITADKEARAEAFSKFSKKQKKILETTEEFKLFIEDWERKTTRINELSAENKQLKHYIERLEEPGYENEDEREF